MSGPTPLEATSVGDAMSRGVISCLPDDPLRDVARLMATYGVHAVFVFEPSDLHEDAPPFWSLVSDLDLVASTPLDLDGLTAGDAAISPLVTIAANDSIRAAGCLMATHGVGHLAVTDPASREPIGVISTLDIARAIAE